jgi:hypothetical protein
MKVKNIFGALAMTVLMAGAPVTLTSCDDDDVTTIVSILDALLSTDDLNGTTWANYQSASDGSQYIALLIGFGNGQVELYEDSYVDKDGTAILQSGTYTLDTNNNTLTLSLDTGTRRYTITEFKANSSMTLTYNGKTIRLVPYTG